MLTFLRYNYILRNISLFVKYIEGTEVTSDKLRNTYFKCLNVVQKHKFHFHVNHGEIFLDFNHKDFLTQESVKHLSGITKLTEEHEFTKDEIDVIKHNMKLSFVLLENYDPEISNVIHLLIGSFVFAKDKQVGAASRSNCLGVTFLNPQPDWQLQDYAECILHESVHQSIFLDDMVNSIFLYSPSEMAKNDGLIISAIRKKRRQYDVSFQSACVCAAIIDFHIRLGISRKIHILYPNLLITIKELKLKEKFLTESGKNILRELEQFAYYTFALRNYHNTLV